MKTLTDFALRQKYEKVRGLGDRLELMKQQIDWEHFRPIITSVFKDNKVFGGRPHTDEIVVVRALLLQAWYGLSDPELEFQINDRLSFRNFLGFPESVPDFCTIWKIRERLKEAGVYEQIWAELQRQLDVKGYSIKKGVIQDAAFIESDVGRKRQYKEKKAKKEGKDIEYSEKQKSHIDHDATYSIKHGQVHYGYKSHVKLDVKHKLIREVEVTTASVHDGQINLIEEGDVAAYRDKAYVGSTVPLGVANKTLLKKSKLKKLNGGQQKRNKSISKIRAPGERLFAVIKRIFNGEHTLVKTLRRVKIKEFFKAFAYNLYQLVTLKRAELAIAV